MEITFLDIFDMLRAMIGTLTCVLVFVYGTTGRRESYRRRLLTGLFLMTAWIGLYVPAMYFASHTGNLVLYILLSAVWWFACDVVALWVVWYLYDIQLSNLLFRGLMGMALNSIVTLILRYVFVIMLFPDYDERHPVRYILIAIMNYAVLEIFFYHLLAVKMADSGHTVIRNSRHNMRHCIVTIAILSLSSYVASTILEFSIAYDQSDIFIQYLLNAYYVPWFCIFILFVLYLSILFNQYTTFQMLAQRQENDLLRQLEEEKAQQYAFTRENIDLINHKCHDLKYRIQALKLTEGAEKEQMIEDVTRNIQFYDASIQTDNPTLNTILTEKSLLCTGAGIRLSCSVQIGSGTDPLSKIEVIDLYTMLGNALDNAIEHVRQYDDPDKRTISLSIRRQGSMLLIFVENYFEGQLEIRGGFPVTGKQDKRYHGFGIKSINMIAKKYDGDSMVSASGNTFSLHILIPV